MLKVIPRLTATVLLGITLQGRQVSADSAVAPGILNPRTAAEAWNVIRLVTANVDRLIDEQRATEIPAQISYCTPALRILPLLVCQPEETQQLEAQVSRAFISVTAIATSAQQDNLIGTRSALTSLRKLLVDVTQHFNPSDVKADIFVCPMHPDITSADAATPCAKCAMQLIPRRIPYSTIYTRPGKPSVQLTAVADSLIVAGQTVHVTIRMHNVEGQPVIPGDLLEMHTQPIHLLIEEPGLADYHHEHPVPTERPGEYVFSFTPRKTAPYRIWADLVPAATGIQELPFVDLPSAGMPIPPRDLTDQFTSTVGKYRFALSYNGSPLPVKAGQSRDLAIRVSDLNDQPVISLQPVMNAFAHLVGFYADYETVVHLHPRGGDVLDPSARGGPAFSFPFFATKPGFIRLYCQVNIDGQMLFAPFNINVEP